MDSCRTLGVKRRSHVSESYINEAALHVKVSASRSSKASNVHPADFCNYKIGTLDPNYGSALFIGHKLRSNCTGTFRSVTKLLHFCIICHRKLNNSVK